MLKLNKRRWGKEFWDWYDNLVKWFIIVFIAIFLLIGVAIVITSVVEDEKIEESVSYLFLGILFTIIIIFLIWITVIYIKSEIKTWRANKLKDKEHWSVSALRINDNLRQTFNGLEDEKAREHALITVERDRERILRQVQEENNELSDDI